MTYIHPQDEAMSAPAHFERSTLLPDLAGGLDMARAQLAEESIGQRIARLRKQNGITQTDLAELLGVTQPLVSD